MLFQFEHHSVVCPNSFKDSVAIEQPVVKHRYAGFRSGKEFPVYVHKQVLLSGPAPSLLSAGISIEMVHRIPVDKNQPFFFES